MNRENLDAYLNDHLAGSVGAVELLNHLLDVYQGSPLAVLISALLKEIEADQRTLQGFIHDLGLEERGMRKAGAWVVEKFTRLKLRLESPPDSLGLFVALEGITLGILGKEALWKALAAAAGNSPELRILDYESLQSRARDQFERVEAKRLEIAAQTL